MLCQVSVTVQVSVLGAGQAVQVGIEVQVVVAEVDGSTFSTGAEVMLKGMLEVEDLFNPEAVLDRTAVTFILVDVFLSPPDMEVTPEAPVPANKLPTISVAAFTIPPTTPVA